jgi:hypothetical protein
VGASPTRQPLQPEATGAATEVTNWLKPSECVSRTGDSASVQAVTRVNAEQALYEAFEVKHYLTAFITLHPSFFVRLEIPFLRPDPRVLEAGARRDCQGRPSLCAGLTLRRFQAAP